MNEPFFLSVDPNMLKSEERIIVAAIRVFSDYPLEKASLRMIAKEAGISFSSITYYFKTKENLYREVLLRILSFVLDLLPQMREKFSNRMTVEKAKEELRAIIGALTERLYGNTNASILAKILLREHISPSSVYDMLFEEFFSKVIDRFTNLVRKICPKKNERQATIQAFSIIGQVLAFRIERELMVRKLGLTGFSPEEIEELKNTIIENIFRQLEVEP